MSLSVSKSELVIGRKYTKCCFDLIQNAQQSIDVLMFEWRWYEHDFSCDASRINQAILRAARRGVKVRALVNGGSAVGVLKEQGIDARTIDKSKLLHSKCVIVDGARVLMGSHNLTENAMTSNIETSLQLDSEELAQQLQQYFNSLWQS